jgi:hypothetical protein
LNSIRILDVAGNATGDDEQAAAPNRTQIEPAASKRGSHDDATEGRWKLAIFIGVKN